MMLLIISDEVEIKILQTQVLRFQIRNGRISWDILARI